MPALTLNDGGVPDGLWVRRIGIVRPTRRMVLLHGFTQIGTSWSVVGAELAASGIGVLFPDLPGHGNSATVDADLERCADLVADVGRSTAGPSTYVGYSMGGRVALHLALRHPELVDGLVLIGATAGIDDEHERTKRVAADDALAEALASEGVDAFLTRWLNNPLFERLPTARADIDGRRVNTVAGLTASLRRCGTGTQRPLWDELAQIHCPTLVLAGEYDAKFIEIGQRLASSIGANATSVTVAGAGHAAHLEQPASVTRHLLSFADSW